MRNIHPQLNNWEKLEQLGEIGPIKTVGETQNILIEPIRKVDPNQANDRNTSQLNQWVKCIPVVEMR